MRYFVGLGSNIEPRRHLPLMLRALLRLSPVVHVGRVLQTEPIGVVGEPFLNVPAAICSDLPPAALKARFNILEAGFGRDRSDPASKQKSRTADLDILFWIDEAAVAAPAELLPKEPYMRPMLLELLGAMGIAAVAERPALRPGVALTLDGVSVGEAPLTLRLVGGKRAVVDLAALTGPFPQS